MATLSVFSRTGWVSRKLTSKELTMCYDLPVMQHKAWDYVSKDLPFLEATPSKVLMAVGVGIAESLGKAPIATRSPGPLSPEATNYLPPLPSAPLTNAGVSIKAVKADDAEAEVSLWNAELAEMFLAQLKGLSAVRLGRMCEAWRMGIMCWWKKAMTREVRQYLFAKYGPNWESPPSRSCPELGKD